MSGWQDIASAPKDGTHILLYAGPQIYNGKAVEPRLTYGYWYAPEHGKYLGDCGGECRCPEYGDPPEPLWWSEDGGFTPEHPPSQWQPLPAPPNTPTPAESNGRPPNTPLEGVREAVAQDFVRMVARLEHSEDEGYYHPIDDGDDRAAMDSLVARARDILAPLPSPDAGALSRVIERDRSNVASAVAALKRAIASREHLRAPGRGPFAWDDEQYQREFGEALDEIEAALKPLELIARDWTDCPTDPKEIALARSPDAGVVEALRGALDKAEDLALAIQRNEIGESHLGAADDLLAALTALAALQSPARKGKGG